MIRLSTPLLALALLAGCAGSEVLSGSDAGDPTPATADAIPTGTTMQLRLNERLGTTVSGRGDSFTATVADAVRAETGRVAIPAGATAYGTVTGVNPSENVGDQAAIRLSFDRIEVDGQSYPFSAEVVRADVETQGRGVDASDSAIGAAAGAALGLILEGDILGTLTGGALGAGAGTAVSLGTDDANAVLPAGTVMTVRTEGRIDL